MIFRPLSLLIALLVIGGCATQSRIVTADAVEQPVRMELAAPAADGLRFSVVGVILTNSEGSWVRDAQWVEYLVNFTNEGSTPAVIDSLSLRSALPRPSLHATRFESLSDGTSENLRLTGNLLGTVAVATMIPPGLSLLAAASTGSAVAGAATFMAAVPFAVTGGVIYAVFTTARDAVDRTRIQETLDARGLSLPLTIPPRRTVIGSAFFPLTPHLHRIVAHFARDEASPGYESTIDLAPVLPATQLTRFGCGFARFTQEPAPLPPRPPLAVARDGRIEASIERVIIRDGPGSWSTNADWDEYRLIVKSLKPGNMQLTKAVLQDSLDRLWSHGAPRCARLPEKRKNDRSIIVKALYAIPVLPLFPFVVAADISAHAEQAAIIKALDEHETKLPLMLAEGTATPLGLLFPITPLPRFLTLDYVDSSGTHQIRLNLVQPLAELHAPLSGDAAARR